MNIRLLLGIYYIFEINYFNAIRKPPHRSEVECMSIMALKRGEQKRGIMVVAS